MRQVAVVVGAGTMGAGIALLLAHKGLSVSLTGRRSSGLEPAMERMKGTLAFLASQRHLEASEPEQALTRLRPSLDLPQALASADLVIEAITEDPDGKRAIFATIGAHTPPPTLSITIKGRPLSVGKDVMDSVALGDLPGISLVMIDGEIRVAGRSQQTPPPERTALTYGVGEGGRAATLRGFAAAVRGLTP